VRTFAIISTCAIAGVVGAAIGGAAAFCGLFGLLRAISLFTKNDDIMSLMWLTLLIVPVLAIFAFVFGVLMTFSVWKERSNTRAPRGFDVVTKADDSCAS
jgi:hypothetical protein